MRPPPAEPTFRLMRRIARAALAEDRARADVTSRALIPAGLRIRAAMVARSRGVVAGLGMVVAVYRELDRSVWVRVRVRDGSRVRAGTRLADIRGPARAVLAGERAALNFVQRLSGVATLTRRHVDRARRTRASIFHTRKTTPLLRALERAAVLAGGGRLHRGDLSDAVLIKENHFAALRAWTPAEVAATVRTARKRFRGRPIEVEIQDLSCLKPALESGADTVMFDNLSPAVVKWGVRIVRAHAARARRRILTEASGNITPARVQAFARAGVDRISVGALTHSAPSLDISLDIVQP